MVILDAYFFRNAPHVVPDISVRLAIASELGSAEMQYDFFVVRAFHILFHMVLTLCCIDEEEKRNTVETVKAIKRE